MARLRHWEAEGVRAMQRAAAETGSVGGPLALTANLRGRTWAPVAICSRLTGAAMARRVSGGCHPVCRRRRRTWAPSSGVQTSVPAVRADERRWRGRTGARQLWPSQSRTARGCIHQPGVAAGSAWCGCCSALECFAAARQPANCSLPRRRLDAQSLPSSSAASCWGWPTACHWASTMRCRRPRETCATTSEA